MSGMLRNGGKRARRLLSGTALVGVAAAGTLFTSPAFAENECGATTQGVVTCPASGNPYPTGISYATPPVDPLQDPGLDPTVQVYDLTVNLGDGVAVDSGANPGVSLTGWNDGAVTLNSFGNTTIDVAGTGALGVIANTNAGDLTINTDSITTDGRASGGINANSASGNITINSGTMSIVGDGSVGISANSFAGNVSITAGTVNVNGYYATGISAYSAYGNIAIDAGTVTTTADGSFYNFPSTAISATNLFGTIDIAAGTVSTTADYSDGIHAVSFYGDSVSVDAGSISTAGFASNGAFVQAAGDASLTVDTIATTGDNSYGAVVLTTGGGDASITSTGSISTAGAKADGVVAVAINGGDVDVTVHDVSTLGDSSPAVYASGDNVSVTSTGTISTAGADSDGIHVETDSTGYYDGNIVIDAGAVQTLGDHSDGIDASAANYGAVTVTHGAVTTAGVDSFGVVATGLYDVGVTGSSVTTTGEEAAGVYAVSIFGNVTVNEGTVSTAGTYAPGIVGASYFGDVSITADSVTTTGDASKGVYGVAVFAGNTDITVRNVTTSGAYSTGVDAQARGDASVTVTGTVSTSGYAAEGVHVYAVGAGSVTNTGTIRTSGDESDGIHVESIYGDVTIAGTGSVATTGDFSTGIFARSYAGTIDITAGTVTTTGLSSGIDAYAAGGVSVTAGTVRTTGAGANAINAGGFYSVDVTAGTVSTTGAGANGIAAVSFGGDLDVTVGSVMVSGAGSTAIRALGFGGGTEIAVTGTVRSTQATAISILAAGAGGAGGPAVGDPARDGIARLTVAAGGSVQGGTTAVSSTALTATQIVNNGAITGGTGYAIAATGGAATIANNGALTGRLLLTANADRLTNAGTFTMIGNSDFGAGADGLINSGTLRLGTSSAVQAVTLAGLETLTNSGLVDLRNARAGDTLTIGGYSGTGAATLGLDIAFGATTATVDRLNLITASGSTQVVLNPISGPAILIPATTIVQASAASASTAFTIAAATQNFGLIQYGVLYNPTARAYQLVSAPNATVYRQAKLGEGLASVWNRSADAITAHLSAGRDAGWGNATTDSSGRLWLQMFGELNKRDDRRSFAFNGLVQNNVDTGYKQDAFGGQVGFDLLGAGGDEGGFTLGISGGYLSSTMTFRGNDRFDIDAVNGTVYGAFQAGNFFLNGIAKYDHAWIGTRGNAPQANFNLDTKADTWGGKLEVGVRAGSDKLFFEPAASIAYTSTDPDGYSMQGGRFDFDTYKGLRGKVGGRIGGSAALGATSTLVFYAGGTAVHEFKGDDRLNFSSGGQSIAIANSGLGSYGQGTIGFTIATAAGVTGFIEGHGEYGDRYKGGGGRAGLRIKF